MALYPQILTRLEQQTKKAEKKLDVRIFSTLIFFLIYAERRKCL